MDTPRSGPPSSPHRLALQQWVPLWPLLRGYERAWLPKDLFAGLALSAVLVPLGLSYAEAAGLPVMVGLYATIGALIGYALFGPSRILVLGPDSALAALIGATIAPLAHGDAAQTVALSTTLAVMAGALCVLLGVAKLGFVTDLLSHPIRLGFLNGIAVTLIAGELPRLLGLADSNGSAVESLVRAGRGLMWGNIQPISAAIGLSCVAMIVILRRYAPRVPGVLIAILAAGAAGWWLHRQHIAFAPVAQALSSTWRPPRLPSLSLEGFLSLAGGAIAIALVSFADISIVSRVFAPPSGEQSDRNQQLVALGAANLFAGFLNGCPVSSSASRTPVAQAAGAQTQVANLVAAASTALLLLVAPSLMTYVPNAALAAIVICAAFGIVDARNAARLFRIHRSEFFVSILCLAGVVLLGALPGIFMSIGFAIASFVWRAWHPYDAVLGQVAGRRGYHDVNRHPEAKQFPGLLLFRWDAPLFFANAEIFAEHVGRAITGSRSPVRCIVIAAEPVTDIDVTAAEVLASLHQALKNDGIQLWFAEMKGPAKDRLRRYGLYDTLGSDASFFATVGEAVDRFRAQRGSKV